VFGVSNSLLQSILAEPARVPKVLVVLDESLAAAQPHLAKSIESYFAACVGWLDLAGPPLIMEGGERAKASYFHVSEIQSLIDRHHVDRHSYLVGVGGGALLDVAGLAAATAHRGVRHVRIPTTVLSQNDSGVGVKNGINAFGKKNFIGAFAPPFAVINDFDLLASSVWSATPAHWRGWNPSRCGCSSSGAPRCTSSTLPGAGTRLNWVRSGRWTSGIGRRTSSNSFRTFNSGTARRWPSAWRWM
jgi:hypothetical protein